jgi:ABC-type branched-subunit amino acid transport system ATPase component
MKLGIIGFPQSGKTTLFNLLTGADAATRRVSRGELHVGWRGCRRAGQPAGRALQARAHGLRDRTSSTWPASTAASGPA